MEDITDSPFRRLCKSFGADVVVTEFISSEGLIREAWKSRKKLSFEPDEHPIGVQIFGADVDSMVQAARVAEEANPDFIDLNFGCPVRKIVMKGGGAALLKDIPKMIAMTRAVVKAVKIPVTIKTRLGWDEQSRNIVSLAEQLQDSGIAAITIHGRTRSQLYGGKADWNLIGAVKNNPRIYIPVYGNGDIDSGEKAKEMFDRYGVDGIMIGRAAIGNPWIFKEIRHYLSTGNQWKPPGIDERVRVLLRHLTDAVDFKGERTAILEFRKLYGGYLRSFSGCKSFRMRLMMAGTPDQVMKILSELQGTNSFSESFLYL